MPSTSSMVTVFDGRVAPPTFGAIETTKYCNLECPFCIQFQDGTTVTGPHMDLATFAAVADKLFPHLERLQPTVSGEPLMSRGLEHMLEAAARHGLRVEYYSNGTLLNDRMIALILPTMGRLNVSFDGATRETFEALRRGASYDKVLANVRRMVTAARRLPLAEQPQIGFACTLQAANVRELPELVDLAADLGLDFVGASHVLPGTAEIQQQSLHHHRQLAREHLRRAFERARARGLPFSVQPLAELVVAMAADENPISPHAHGRAIASADGVEADVPAGEVNQDRLRPWPLAAPRGAVESLVAARRAARDLPGDAGAEYAQPIWTCGFLWERLYVNHVGGATPCCIPGVPDLGNLVRQSLDEVWNGPIQRALRLALVHRDPAPCCRGCQHIRTVEEPAEIRRLLGGRAIPGSRPPLPAALRPLRGDAGAEPHAAERHDRPPRLSWAAAAGTEGYEVEISGDGYRSLLFATPWHGIELDQPAFEVPAWAWEVAPRGQELAWRALGVFTDHKRVVGAGAIVRPG